MLKKILSVLLNRYLIITTIFLVWILFFDRNNFFSQIKLANELKEVRQQKKYYQKEIRKSQIETLELLTNSKNLEKFGREKYLMKRDSEDIFVIVREGSTLDNAKRPACRADASQSGRETRNAEREVKK